MTIDLACAAVTFGYQAGVQTPFIQYNAAALCAQGGIGKGVERCTHHHVAITIAVEVAGQADRKTKVRTRVGCLNGIAANVVGNVVQVDGVFEGVDVEGGGGAGNACIVFGICVAASWQGDAGSNQRCVCKGRVNSRARQTRSRNSTERALCHHHIAGGAIPCKTAARVFTEGKGDVGGLTHA